MLKKYCFLLGTELDHGPESKHMEYGLEKVVVYLSLSLPMMTFRHIFIFIFRKSLT